MHQDQQLLLLKSDMTDQKKQYEVENIQLKEQIKKLEDQSAMYEQSVVNYFEKEKERRTQDSQAHSLNILCKPNNDLS